MTLALPRPLWQRYVAVLVYLLIAMVLIQIAGILLFTAVGKGQLASENTMNFRMVIYSMVIQMMGFLLPAPLLLRFTRAQNYTFSPARAADILLACGLIFASLIFFSILYGLLGVEPKQLAFIDQNEIQQHKSAFVAVTVILAPGYEEWVFRGLLFGVLVTGAEKLRHVIIAALFCMVLFTAIHYEGAHSLTALPPILAIAAIFQFVTWRSGSLWPAVCAHALQNLIYAVAMFARYAVENTK